MAKESEYLVGLSESLWINNTPITPGTYDRIREIVDDTNQPTSMWLRRLDLTERPIDLSEETVFLEHLVDEVEPLEKLVPEDFNRATYKKLKRGRKIKVRGTEIGLGKITTAPNIGSDCLIFVNRAILEKKGVTSVNILIDERRIEYPTEMISLIVRNPYRNSLTIAWINPEDNETFYSTYRLSKFTSTPVRNKT